ncbi:MAG: hypothetical protein H6983_10585 [Ectothiorhodospiraceae bacterium]|nr:hypothetical protein [Chromatiales bacterium]MCP5154603.1 hypothetical protein [Ectothiorhodospiraceae bacterium]
MTSLGGGLGAARGTSSGPAGAGGGAAATTGAGAAGVVSRPGAGADAAGRAATGAGAAVGGDVVAAVALVATGGALLAVGCAGAGSAVTGAVGGAVAATAGTAGAAPTTASSRSSAGHPSSNSAATVQPKERQRGYPRFLVTLVLIALSVAGAFHAPPSLAGIADTKHNLVGSARAPLASADPSQVCAYCHTPHGESASAPAWQPSRPADGGTTFQTYDSFGRVQLAEVEQRGSVSLACMACHDGTQAMNVTGSAGVTDGARPLVESVLGAVQTVDLSVSHPVGVPYRGHYPPGLTTTTPPNPLISPVPIDPTSFRTASADLIDGITVWWVETGAPGRQRDDVQLYARGESPEQAAPYVECASCHDPHRDAPNFLRLSGSREGLCAACHAL